VEATVKVLREGPVKITKAAIDAAWRRRAKDTRLVLGDAECRGLALVVNPGSMAWTFSYKPRGADPVSGRRFATRSVTIGTPASHSPDDARAEANRLKGRAKSGRDPAAERREKAAAGAARRARTLGRLLDAYADALPRRPKLRGSGTASAKHVSEEIAHARAAVATMKAEDKPASDVTAADLRVLLSAEAVRPAVARHRFGALSRFFDWCQDEGHVAANPCALLAKARRPRGVAARDHFLHSEQLARVWSAAEGLPPVHRDLVRFIVAVPCRRGEAARLDWSHLDLGAGAWTQPSRLTKNGGAHRIHLHALALALLRERHVAAGRPAAGLVFPAPQSGGPVDTFSDIKAALDGASGLAGWRFHDLRRSFATALGERGIPEPVADAVLNHRQAATRGGVLGVYQRAQRWPEQVGAMNAWGAMLAEAIEAASAASGEAGA
jgi:integrase